MDELEIRIAELKEREDLAKLRPALDGTEVMEILALTPGPAIKGALKFLMEIRLNEGEISKTEATHRLKEWWAESQ
jgi:poly(A) polymerase